MLPHKPDKCRDPAQGASAALDHTAAALMPASSLYARAAGGAALVDVLALLLAG